MWSATRDYDLVVEANRILYDEHGAEWYDRTESCLGPRFAAELDRDLDGLVALLPPDPRALDACGGTGNVALKLAVRGVPTTLVDVSPHQLRIAESKAQGLSVRPRFVASEIGSFLAGAEPFDLITFSSALHHIQDVEGVLRLAYDRLRPGGFLYSNYDPTRRDRLSSVGSLALKFDYVLFKALAQTSDLPAAIGRRISRMVSPGQGLTTATAAKLAEFHVDDGIDDGALVESAERIGYRVVRHDRYPDARHDPIRRLLAFTGDTTTFKLLLRRPL